MTGKIDGPLQESMRRAMCHPFWVSDDPRLYTYANGAAAASLAGFADPDSCYFSPGKFNLASRVLGWRKASDIPQFSGGEAELLNQFFYKAALFRRSMVDAAALYSAVEFSVLLAAAYRDGSFDRESRRLLGTVLPSFWLARWFDVDI